jgi:hypothetical protein
MANRINIGLKHLTRDNVAVGDLYINFETDGMNPRIVTEVSEHGFSYGTINNFGNVEYLPNGEIDTHGMLIKKEKDGSIGLYLDKRSLSYYSIAVRHFNKGNVEESLSKSEMKELNIK